MVTSGTYAIWLSTFIGDGTSCVYEVLGCSSKYPISVFAALFDSVAGVLKLLWTTLFCVSGDEKIFLSRIISKADNCRKA